jgi:hypothetical protein
MRGNHRVDSNDIYLKQLLVHLRLISSASSNTRNHHYDRKSIIQLWVLCFGSAEVETLKHIWSRPLKTLLTGPRVLHYICARSSYTLNHCLVSHHARKPQWATDRIQYALLFSVV